MSRTRSDPVAARAYLDAQSTLCIRAAGAAFFKELLGFGEVTQEEKDDFLETWKGYLQHSRKTFGVAATSQALNELELEFLETMFPK